MTMLEWKAEIMKLAVAQARLLAEMSTLEDIKIEPEQLRKNIAAMQSVLSDTLDILEDVTDSSSK